jgi:hypothetical protein
MDAYFAFFAFVGGKALETLLHNLSEFFDDPGKVAGFFLFGYCLTPHTRRAVISNSPAHPIRK